MNRREFVKALATTPLLGLLAKLPKIEDELNVIMSGDPGYIDIMECATSQGIGRKRFPGLVIVRHSYGLPDWCWIEELRDSIRRRDGRDM